VRVLNFENSNVNTFYINYHNTQNIDSAAKEKLDYKK